MTHLVTADGVDLSVTVSGPSDAKVAAVLVHGWCLSSEIFRYQRHILVDEPVRLVTYDSRGHGRSGKAPTGTTTIDQLAEDLRTVLDAVCGDVPVVLVRRRPVDAAIARRILLGAAAARQDVRLGRRLISTAHPGVVDGFFRDLMRHDRHEALRQLSGVPVRILTGGADRLTPIGHSHRIAHALPHARLLIFPGAGHMIPLERPEELAAEIMHLARCAAPQRKTPAIYGEQPATGEASDPVPPR